MKGFVEGFKISEYFEQLERTISDIQQRIAKLEQSKVDSEQVEGVIEHEGVKYRKVEREARPGDVVIFENIPHGKGTTNGKPYKVIDEFRYIDDEGDDLDIYGWNLSCPNPLVYEPIEETQDVQQQTATVEKTPNQLRKEVIEKAKEFVDKNSVGNNDLAVKLEFIVNKEKRTIVALVKGVFSNIVYHRGIAKCHPNDVFNEHIGKAIALRRALGLDVSEFENAVQPTYAAGQILSYFLGDTEKIRRISYVNGTEIRFDNKKYIHSDRDKRYGLDKAKIIDDTNAQY